MILAEITNFESVYRVKFCLYDRKKDYSFIRNEQDLFLYLSSQIVESNINKNGIPRCHQLWVAADHLLILDFDDEQNPCLAEQLAFKFKEQLFKDSLIVRSGKKGAKLVFASWELVGCDSTLIERAIKRKINELTRRKKISKKVSKIIDLAPLHNIKRENPVRLLGLRWKGEEEGKFGGEMYFAHLVTKPAQTIKEYFEEQKKYVERYLLKSEYEILLQQAQEVIKYCNVPRPLPTWLKKELIKLKKEKEFEEKVKRISVENNFKFLNVFERSSLQNWRQIALEVLGQPNRIKDGLFIYDKCIFCGKGRRGARKVHVCGEGYFCKVSDCGFHSWKEVLKHFKREDLLEPGIPGFVERTFKDAIAFVNFGQARKFLKKNVKKISSFLNREGKRAFILKGVQGIGKTTFVLKVAKKFLKNWKRKRVLYLLPAKVGREKLAEKAKEFKKFGLKTAVAPAKTEFCEKIAEFRESFAGFPEIFICGQCRKRKKCKYFAEIKRIKEEAEVILGFGEAIEAYQKIFEPDLLVVDEVSAHEFIQNVSLDDSKKALNVNFYSTDVNDLLLMQLEDSLRLFVQIWEEYANEVRNYNFKKKERRELLLQGDEVSPKIWTRW